MQEISNKDFLSKQRTDIVLKYRDGPTKNKIDDWENPQYTIYAITDYYGFLHDGGISDEFLLKEAKIKKLDCKRETKWRKLIERKISHRTSQTSYASSSDNQFASIVGKMSDSVFREEITKRVYKGIPQQFKSSIWQVFLDINKMKNKKTRVYEVMLKKALERSPDVNQIDLDVNRTFRNTIYFRDRFNDRQQSLLHVLSAYSMYNTEIGYCQGMSEICGLLLMYMVEEEDVFWGLSQIMTSPRWCMHGMFIAGFPRLLTFFAHLNVILQKLLPKIAKHFEKLELLSSSYALKWFMQCFLDRVPFTLFLRLWDIYLLEGEKILIAMAYNILKLHKKRIIKMDHCSILQFLQCELRKDFLYDDDFVVESLKACIEELRKHKLSVPPPPQPNELPSRPFGTDHDLRITPISSVKDRKPTSANPDEMLRRSTRKPRHTDDTGHPITRKSASQLTEKKPFPLKPPTRVRSQNENEVKGSVPTNIKYRISHKNPQLTKSKSLLLADDDKSHKRNSGNPDSLTKVTFRSKTQDREFIKSVPDLSNSATVASASLKSASNHHIYKRFDRRIVSSNEPKEVVSNHVSSNPTINANSIKKSTTSSFTQNIPTVVKRRPRSFGPETLI